MWISSGRSKSSVGRYESIVVIGYGVPAEREPGRLEIDDDLVIAYNRPVHAAPRGDGNRELCDPSIDIKGFGIAACSRQRDNGRGGGHRNNPNGVGFLCITQQTPSLGGSG